MIQIEVLTRDDYEAKLGIISNDMMLEAFACPFKGIDENKTVELFGFGTFNIGPCDTQQPPEPMGAHGYHICAEVVDLKERLVKVGEIPIRLDQPIDSEFKPGTLTQFRVQRLDY